MVKVDMWYNDDPKTADKIDIEFYANDGEYRGNIYKNGKTIGDYVSNSSTELEEYFSQLQFNWN